MREMSQSGASVRTMSHKCEKYESEWSRCEKKKKRVHVNHNRVQLEFWPATQVNMQVV